MSQSEAPVPREGEWEVTYRSTVEQDVARLPERIRQRAFGVVNNLTLDAFPQGCKKLQGAVSRYSIRIRRDYRVVYSVFKTERVIKIEFIGHRKDAYRWF
jgi:mRNA-degrading endonuclease RelE of RelBE toxin-antitoxin system